MAQFLRSEERVFTHTVIHCRRELRSSPHTPILEKLLLPPAGSSLVLGWGDE